MNPRHLVLPAAAAALLAVAVASAVRADGGRIARDPPSQPPASPFESRISGTGLVEPSGEEVLVGAPVSGVVGRVFVRTGDLVQAGDPLFDLDVRDLRAEVALRSAAVARAAAESKRLRSMPRAEDLPPAVARVAEAKAQFDEARTRLSMVERVADAAAVSQEDRARRKSEALAAGARFAEASAELVKLRAGAWDEDIAVADAALAEAEAALQRAVTDVERATVRAPSAARVLDVDVRPGQFAAAASGTALVVLGSADGLDVRVDIDEADAWRVRPGALAEAQVRGNAALRVPLEFVRIEPRVVPKKDLSGMTTERVDTRVLQVVYRAVPGEVSLFAGQQMDVFLVSPSAATAASGGAR